MELTNELKEKLARCAAAEEVKAVLAEAGVELAGVELADEQLEQAAGGELSSRFRTVDTTQPQYQSITITFPDGTKHTIR